MKRLSYKKSGVDIDKANVFVDKIKPMIKRAQAGKVSASIGGFGALFAFDKDKYKEPMLVSSTDGVGTKLKIATLVDKHDTVGIDLVAMNVDDVLCLGARPLFFLDYIACGKLKSGVLTEVVKGVIEGCRQADCTLIGGETAEMPGMYAEDDYDLAGFAVGVVDKDRIIDGSKIKPGDKIVGLASSGLHSNGFSLVRKVFNQKEIKRMSEELLMPTRIYTRPVLSLLDRGFDRIKGISHITGGAFYDKLPKIFPEGTSALIKKSSWQVPEIFKLLQNKGSVPEKDMFRTFNMGIGMALVVDKAAAAAVVKEMHNQGVNSWVIGEVVKGKGTEIV